MYKIIFSQQASADLEIIEKSTLFEKFIVALKEVQEDPLKNPQLYTPLLGCDRYVKRINFQHYIVYLVDQKAQTIGICACWNSSASRPKSLESTQVPLL